jgi:hypothetical protein
MKARFQAWVLAYPKLSGAIAAALIGAAAYAYGPNAADLVEQILQALVR